MPRKEVLASITIANYHSRVELSDGKYYRITQHGPGSRKIKEECSEITAATLCTYSDWATCERLQPMKNHQFPFQAILAELMGTELSS